MVNWLMSWSIKHNTLLYIIATRQDTNMLYKYKQQGRHHVPVATHEWGQMVRKMKNSWIIFIFLNRGGRWKDILPRARVKFATPLHNGPSITILHYVSDYSKPIILCICLCQQVVLVYTSLRDVTLYEIYNKKHFMVNIVFLWIV